MTDDEKLMQQALEALNRSDYLGWQLNIPIIKALRERLAQPEQPSVPWSAALESVWGEPEQEPVAWMHNDIRGNVITHRPADLARHPERWMPLYTTPPQRKPLTDEVIWLEYQRFWPFHPAEEPKLAKDIVKFARAIEAKLKEKNNG